MTRPLCLAALLFAACGGSGPFSMHTRDSGARELEQVANRIAEKPVAPAAEPLAYLVTRDTAQEILAFDVRGGNVRWRVPAEVGSRVTVAPGVLVHLDKQGFLVARERSSGAVRWRYSIGGGKLVGVAAGQRDLFVTTQTRDGAYRVEAWSGETGRTRWEHESAGELGAPVVAAGLVAVPYRSQWLVLLDEGSGQRVARLRSGDQHIAFVRADRGNLYFGSRTHVRRVDGRAAAAYLDQATSGTVTIPPALRRASFERDPFDPVQANYSAYDRTRILWRARPAGKALAFEGERAVFIAERYLFSLHAKSAAVSWAHMAPGPVVAASETGGAIAYAADDGTISVLDAVTGAPIIRHSVSRPLIGASFDVEGFAPSASASKLLPPRSVLTAIARDRDARFRAFQAFAVGALAALPGAEPSADLISILEDERAATPVKEAARAALVSRKSSEAVPVLLDALKRRPSYLAERRPQAVAAAAEALAALGPEAFTPAQAEEVKSALLSCLEHPATDTTFLRTLIQAVHTLDARGNAPAVRAFLLTYRADPDFDRDPSALRTAIDVLLATPDEWNREVVSFTATDPRTRPAVREYARAALLR